MAPRGERAVERYFSDWLAEQTAVVRTAERFRKLGTVEEVVGLTMVSQGPPAQVGETCIIESGSDRRGVRAQVIGFRDSRVLLMPLDDIRGIQPGCRVIASGEQVSVPVGRGLLGRVIDAFGMPLDGGGPVRGPRRPIHSRAPRPMERHLIDEAVCIGVRAIDALLTCAKGQRVGIFAGSGLGKSTLLGMIARNTRADVNVIALVGERGREVFEFVEDKLGPALERSIVVVATADEPALTRLQAGFAATTIAEALRDEGAHVMLLMDSITRLARAQREVGLAAGEIPAHRGFPPSVYAMMPQLVERAGPSASGTITGLYTVLVEGDDMLEPVADTVRATLDGHIVLSRALAEKGQYPAIDINASMSRAMARVTDEKHWRLAEKARRLLRAYAEIEDLIAVGAYEPGGDPWVDAAVAINDRMREFLTQGMGERTEVEEALAGLRDVLDVADEIIDGRVDADWVGT